MKWRKLAEANVALLPIKVFYMTCTGVDWLKPMLLYFKQ